MVDLLYHSIRMGAQIDDRNIRGPLDDVIATYYLVHDFDEEAGQILEANKTVFAAHRGGKEAHTLT